MLERAHEGFVSAVRVMPDGDSICTCGKDGRFVVWGRSPAERGGRGQTIDALAPVLEIDLASVLGGGGGRAPTYGRAIAVNGGILHTANSPLISVTLAVASVTQQCLGLCLWSVLDTRACMSFLFGV